MACTFVFLLSVMYSLQLRFENRCHKNLILGRHFGCRPLDPTLDIWSNFVKRKKEKRKHFTSLQCRKGSQGLLMVTKSYQSYQSLPQVTTSYHGLFSFAYAWVIAPDSSFLRRWFCK